MLPASCPEVFAVSPPAGYTYTTGTTTVVFRKPRRFLVVWPGWRGPGSCGQEWWQSESLVHNVVGSNTWLFIGSLFQLVNKVLEPTAEQRLLKSNMKNHQQQAAHCGRPLQQWQEDVVLHHWRIHPSSSLPVCSLSLRRDPKHYQGRNQGPAEEQLLPWCWRLNKSRHK